MSPTQATERLSAALSDRYRIERELGEGGMATVYLARDLKHDRQVAIKMLKPELGAVLGADRFLAEIRISARLDHPHILTLIDSGAHGDLLYYVLPFVRGESLRDKLDREKQLPLDEALMIARQVASALDYAHRQGLVHRDIKPENILLQEGEAMLADFGIALAVTEAGGNRLTGTGLSLGTPQYMSPEQATGDRLIDARSDVYSLGAVLYEMLAGEPPVTGPNPQAMIAKLMTEKPTALRVVRDAVPAGIDAAVVKALAKLPADRFQGATEFASALERGVTVVVPVASSQRPLAIVAAGVVLALLAFGAWRMTRPHGPELVLGRSEALTTDPGLEISPAISPDGRLVAYSAGTSTRMRVYIRPVGGGRTIPLSDDSTALETQARWSPDGNSLLFLTRGGVSVAPALGGSSRAIIAPLTGDGLREVTTAAWSPDGREIAYVRGDSLMVVPMAGGPGRALANGFQLHSCSWSPRGTWIACASGNSAAVAPGPGFGNIAPSTIVLVPREGGEPISLFEPSTANLSPTWSPDGQWLYFISNRDGPSDIYGVRLSSSGKVRGAPVRLSTGLGVNAISLSGDGQRLAYSVYDAEANIWSVPIPSDGPVTIDGARQVTSGRQVIEAMGLSRDGQWLLYDSDLRGNADIYRIPIAGGQPEQLTSDPANEFAPALSPDGRAVAYHSFRTGTRDIEIKPLDGGPVVQVTNTPAQESYPTWSPDGEAIAYLDQAERAIHLVRREPDGRWSTPPIRLITAGQHDWSADGESIAFIAEGPSAIPGAVMVIPAGGGAPRLIFAPRAGDPQAVSVRWSPDGRQLYYKTLGSDGRVAFWAIPPAGGVPRLLVRFPDLDRQSTRHDFATNGRLIYFTISDRQSDLFIAEITPK